MDDTWSLSADKPHTELMDSLASVPTSSRRLKAIKDVDPLDVVGQSRVGHQGFVPIYVIYGKLERQLIHAH